MGSIRGAFSGFAVLGLLAFPVRAELKPIPLQSKINSVQPMTGLVLWESSGNADTDAVQLEFSYLRYSDVVRTDGKYDWSAVDQKLNAIASRSHQAILRFWDTYPGQTSGVPDSIKALAGYRERTALSENRETGFPDWSHPGYHQFLLDFFEQFAARYDQDPRLAFLQVGFGLWSEYHVYDPGEQLGVNFPSKAFQSQFLQHLAKTFAHTPWMISQDAHVASRTPFAAEPALLDLKFGIFDDSFHLAWSPGYNLGGWEFFGRDRFLRAPAGGEILFPDKTRSDLVADQWPHQAREFGVSFLISEQWLQWIDLDQIRDLGKAAGYRFRVIEFLAGPGESQVRIKNVGTAPIYHDAFVAVNGIRSPDSLKFLGPDETRTFVVAAGGKRPALTIVSDRLVPGQTIQFEANLPAE